MKGRDSQHQLKKITDLCGSINAYNSWPEARKLDNYQKMIREKPHMYNKPCIIRQILGPLIKNKYCVDMLQQLLTLNPESRISSTKAFEMFKYFK